MKVGSLAFASEGKIKRGPTRISEPRWTRGNRHQTGETVFRRK